METNELNIPNHVAIIMDGNGRWAKERGMNRSKGHEAGFETLKKLSDYILSKGVKVLSVYAFSTENFKRSKEEVDFLMNLFENKTKQYFNSLKEKNIKVVFSGKKDAPLSKKIIELMNKIEEESANNTGGTLNICMNYGGHLEIVEATKKISSLVKEGKLEIEDITEDNFSHYLFQELPPIDLLIRTSGESRISNFMIWQLSYAEFYFTDVYFPDFNETEFDKALLDYSKRNRRFGGIKYETKNN